MTKAELKARLAAVKEDAFMSAMSDNFYYTSGRKDATDKLIRELESEIEALCQSEK